MLFCDMPLFGASLEVISTEKTVRSLTFFRENYSSLILIVVIVDSYSRSSDYFKSLLLPQLLRGENDSKQSDEFQATWKRNCHYPIKPKTFFCPFCQQKKHLHVHRRSVSVQDGFFESTELFSLYHCIRIRTQGRVLEFWDAFQGRVGTF